MEYTTKSKLSDSAIAELQNTGFFRTPLSAFSRRGMFLDSSLLGQMAGRQVPLPSSQKRSKQDHFPRFHVRCCFHKTPPPPSALPSNTHISMASTINSSKELYKKEFDETDLEWSSRKSFRILGLQSTVDNPNSVTLQLTGTPQRDKSGKVLEDIIVFSATFIASPTHVVICYLVISDEIYDNRFGVGNNKSPFRGKGFLRFLLHLCLVMNSVKCNLEEYSMVQIHLQIRPDNPFCRNLFSCGFLTSDPIIPPILTGGAVPFWLNGHLHLCCNGGML
jgi:hypothetical protein